MSISASLEKRWKLNTALMELMPFLNLDEALKYSRDLNKYNKPIDDIIRDVIKATINAEKSPSLSDYIHVMHQEGYTVQQILLLAHAPSVMPDNSRPREELLRGWNSNNKFKKDWDGVQVTARGAMVGGALFTIISLGIGIGGVGLGMLNLINPNATETSHIMAKYSFGFTRDFYQAFIEKTKPDQIDLARNTFLAGMGFLGLKDLLKKSNDINLYKKIHHRFSEELDKETLAKVKKDLEDIPLKWQHLLMHLSGDELVLFSSSDNEDRRAILSKNPPLLEQRYLSAISSDASLLKNWQGKLEVAATPFEANISPMITGATLKAAILGMRPRVDMAVDNSKPSRP